MCVSVLHKTLVKSGVSTCHFVSNSLIMAQLSCNILHMPYYSLGIPPQGADLVCFNDSIHLGPSQVVSFHHIENTFYLGIQHMIGFPFILGGGCVWLCLSNE
jgi:hypothetical protein